MKKGVSLIELMVAMAIFSIIMTLVVGAYLVVLRMRGLTGVMRESQQKIRISEETISRLSRQAQRFNISGPTGSTLILYFNINSSAVPPKPPTATKFELKNGANATDGLFMYECTTNMTAGAAECFNWGTAQKLLGRENGVLLNNSSFSRSAVSTSGLTKLMFNLEGKIDGLAPYYSDTFRVQTSVIMESLL